MCLISKDKEKHIADKPIKCYKCLTEKMQSPCYNLKYEFGSTIKSKFTIKRYKECIKVEQGLHTFKTLNRAIKNSIENKFYWFNVITNEYVMTPIIIECVIPENSTYYIGNNGDLVSDKLIIQKVLYDKTPEPYVPNIPTPTKTKKEEPKKTSKKEVKVEPKETPKPKVEIPKNEEKKLAKERVKEKVKETKKKEEVKVEPKPIPKSKIKPKKDEEVNTKKKNDTSSTSKSNDSKKVDSKKKEEVKKKKNNRKIDDEDSVIESLW